MRIGLLSFRLGGLDGVALEAQHWQKVLTRMGRRVIPIAGGFEGKTTGIEIPLLHFLNPKIKKITHVLFDDKRFSVSKLRPEIQSISEIIERQLESVLTEERVKILIVKNVFSLPVNLPGALAVKQVVEKTGIPTLARHHDFAWERARYELPRLEQAAEIIPRSPNVRHTVLSKFARKQFFTRTKLRARVITDSFDFLVPPAKKDAYNRDLPERLGLDPKSKIILQSTRIIPRKHIEHTLELASRLKTPVQVLFTNHNAGDEPGGYLDKVKRLARKLRVKAIFANSHIGPERTRVNGRKIYSFWDPYLFADLFSYPTDLEGFGNQFLEAVAFKLPIFINRYPVYKTDIEPLGFETIAINESVTENAVRRVDKILSGRTNPTSMVEKNFRLGKKHFSFETLEKKLKRLIHDLS